MVFSRHYQKLNIIDEADAISTVHISKLSDVIKEKLQQEVVVKLWITLNS